MNRKLDFYFIKALYKIAQVQGLFAFSVSLHPLKIERSRLLVIYSFFVTLVHLILLPTFLSQLFAWIQHAIEIKLVLNLSFVSKNVISVVRIIVMYISQRYYHHDIYNAIKMLIGILKTFDRMKMRIHLLRGTCRIWYYRRIVGALMQVLCMILLFVAGYQRYTKNVIYLDIICFALTLSFHVIPLTISMMYFGAMFMALIFYKQLGERIKELMLVVKKMKRLKHLKNKCLTELSAEIEEISLVYKAIGIYTSKVNKICRVQLLLVFGSGFTVILLEVQE